MSDSQHPPQQQRMIRSPRDGSLARLGRVWRVAALAMVVVAVAAGTAACSGPSGSHPSSLASPSADAVVATVNGQPVYRGAVEVVRAERRLVGQSDGEAAALKESIDRELVRQEAQRLGVSADPSVVQARTANLSKQMGGADALHTALQKARMTQEQLSQSLTDGVLREALQRAKYPKLIASEATQRRYYAKHVRDLFTQPAAVRLSVVLVRSEGIAKNVVARLKAGHPFAEVAHQFSIDRESGDNGGNLGWVLAGSLPGRLRTAVAATPKAVVSRPVQSAGGWYVFEVGARRAARRLSFADVHARLGSELTRVKRSRALQKWLAGARKRASIVRL
jgi:parvulin-like peptidyl-prolyl isomerase